jgi:hypothetical protein
MTFATLVPVLLVAAFLISLAWVAIFRPRHKRLQEVIRLVRHVEIAELARLVDAGEEWGVRNLLSPQEFRLAQRERVSLAFEYLQRVGHNARVIQRWVGDLYEPIKHKDLEEFTDHDHLIWELVQVSTELRLHTVFARMRMALWLALNFHRWPSRMAPRLSTLRMVGGIDVIQRYQKLIQVAGSLSQTYGQQYYEEFIAAL